MSEFRPQTDDVVLWASVTGPLQAEFQGFHPGPDGAKYARLIVRDGRGLIAVPATQVGPMPPSPVPASEQTTATSDPTPTPGPWKYAGWDAVGCDIVRDGVAPHDCVKVADVKREADAKLICHAVNCHADLLAACRLACGVLHAAWDASPPAVETEAGRFARLTLIAVDAAVAKATGN